MIAHPLCLTVGNLRFDCDAAGPIDGELALLLHGFPQTSYSYRHAIGTLADAGYLAVAPNQRGYSAGARPPAIDDYATPLLLSDALAFADALGRHRFHLVGHDWGGQLAWLLAAHHPERLLTLTVLSRPHPAAFAEALREDPVQAERSRHHKLFRDGNAAARLLEDNARRLRRSLVSQGVAEADVDAYLARLGEHGALDAALNWYRASRDSLEARASVPAVTTPTLYVWGDEDATVGRRAAEATARYVSAPYQFEVLEGVGHFLTDQAEARVSELLLSHLERHAPAERSAESAPLATKSDGK